MENNSIRLADQFDQRHQNAFVLELFIFNLRSLHGRHVASLRQGNDTNMGTKKKGSVRIEKFSQA